MELSWQELEQVTGVQGLGKARIGTGGSEKRHDGRFGVSGLARAVLWRADGDPVTDPRVTRVREISRTGVSLLCDEAAGATVGREVLVALERRQVGGERLAEVARPPIWVYCTVVRSDPVGQKRVVVGVQFVRRARPEDVSRARDSRRTGKADGQAARAGRLAAAAAVPKPTADDPLFRLAFEQAPTPLALVGLDHRFVYANAAFCELVGYTAAEMRELTFDNITHPDDIGLDAHLARRMFAGELASYEMEKRYIRKDGRAILVHLTGSLMRDTRGRVVCAHAAVRPVRAVGGRPPERKSVGAVDAEGERLTRAELERLKRAVLD